MIPAAIAVSALAVPGDAPPPVGPYWVDNLDPFVVHFPPGWFLPGIRWYGLAYIAGFAMAAGMMAAYARRGRLPLNADQRSTLLTALIVGIVGGGRLGYCLLYRPGEFFSNPLYFFRVWEGGMASHGGFAGGLLALWWFGRASGLGFPRVCDVVATLVPPGLFIGRLANFVNGELWGKATTVPWAMIFPLREDGVIVGWTGPRHPSQLYEAFLEGLVLLAFTQWRWWSGPPAGRPGARPNGQLAGEFLIAYALVRCLGEIFREPDEGISLILGLSRGTFYSLFMIAGGTAFIVAARRRVKAQPA
jgi:phosphatidylglycerol---prolipoprotein diacylglyceryl transferase